MFWLLLLLLLLPIEARSADRVLVDTRQLRLELGIGSGRQLVLGIGSGKQLVLDVG